MKRKAKNAPSSTVISTSPPARRTIIATNKLPKIAIRRFADSIRIVIPGHSLATLALAHTIVSAFLSEISELEWSLILAPRVDPGDRLMTCTVVAIDPIRDSASLSVLRSRITQLAVRARVATKLICGARCRTPTHTVVVEEVA